MADERTVSRVQGWVKDHITYKVEMNSVNQHHRVKIRWIDSLEQEKFKTLGLLAAYRRWSRLANIGEIRTISMVRDELLAP